MTVMITDKPLEDFLPYYPTELKYNTPNGLKTLKMNICTYGPFDFRRRDDLITERLPTEDGLRFLTGERFKEAYCYQFMNGGEFHYLYGYLFLFVRQYLRWGRNIALYDGTSGKWLGPETLVSKIDISKKDMDESIIRRGEMYSDALYLFSDSEGISKNDDLTFFTDVDKDHFVNDMAGNLPYMKCDEGLTLDKLFASSRSCVKTYGIYDLDEVEEAISAKGGIGYSREIREFKDYISPIALVKKDEKTGEMIFEQKDGTVNKNWEYPEYHLVKYIYGCSHDVFPLSARMYVKHPIDNTFSMSMMVFVRK